MDADLRFYPEEEIPTFNTVFPLPERREFMALVDKMQRSGRVPETG